VFFALNSMEFKDFSEPMEIFFMAAGLILILPFAFAVRLVKFLKE